MTIIKIKGRFVDKRMLRYKEIKLALQDMICGMNNGDRLPSRTILAKRLDSSRATVDKAVRELEDEGFLESRFGSGTYVARRLEGVQVHAQNWCVILPNVVENIYARLASSIEHAVCGWNTNIILCNSENNAEKQKEYIKRLIMSGVDGFIIVPVVMKNVWESVGLYQSLVQSRIPFVFCNRDVEGVLAPVVKSNDFYGGYIATNHLLERGYRNIVFLAKQRYRTSVERCLGYISALQDRDLEIRRKYILMLENNTTKDCYYQLYALLKSGIPIDGVFCFNDAIAFEAMQAIEDMNLRVSEDIGVIGYDDNEKIVNVKTPLTSVACRIEDIGTLASQVLKEAIDKQEKVVFDYYVIKPYIVERKSCLGKCKL